MKKGRIILGLASLGVTIISAFSFKPMNNRHKLFISFLTSGGINKQCLQCNAWTLAGVGVITFKSCVTSAGSHKVSIPVGTGGKHTLYTQKTVGGKCKTPNARYTLVN